MGFHRTVMRNRARRMARMTGLGMTAVWDDVRALPWAARGCRATVWTCKHKRTLQHRQRDVKHAAPMMRPATPINRVKGFLDRMVETANAMTLLRATARGR